MKSKKIIVWGLVAVIIVAALVAVWFFWGRSTGTLAVNEAPNTATTSGITFPSSSSTTDIANWNTYRNGAYGYSILYPSDWVATSTIKDPNIQAESINIYNPTNRQQNISIDKVTESPNITPGAPLADRVGAYMKNYVNVNGNGWSYSQPTTATIDIYPAFVADITALSNNQPQTTFRLVFFTIQNGLFKISYQPDASSSDMTVSRILSTFSGKI